MLIVTIHDVAPPHLDAVVRLREACAGWGAERVTLLAVPDYHRKVRLRGSRATVRWVRERADAGDEIALHGIAHQQEAPVARRLDRLRAALLTDGEGEMLGTGAACPLRIAAARADLEDLIGAQVAGFVAPAWLEPPGLGRLLARLEFQWHEDALSIVRLPAERRVAPVIGFATRSGWRERAAVAWALASLPFAERWSPARVALHPSDLTSPVVMRTAERVIRALGARHRAVTTSEALCCA